MDSNPLLDPENFPKWMLLSALAALAVGMIVYRFSGNLNLSIATGLFFVIGDYIGLKWLMGRDDDE